MMRLLLILALCLALPGCGLDSTDPPQSGSYVGLVTVGQTFGDCAWVCQKIRPTRESYDTYPNPPIGVIAFTGGGSVGFAYREVNVPCPYVEYMRDPVYNAWTTYNAPTKLVLRVVVYEWFGESFYGRLDYGQNASMPLPPPPEQYR